MVTKEFKTIEIQNKTFQYISLTVDKNFKFPLDLVSEGYYLVGESKNNLLYFKWYRVD